MLGPMCNHDLGVLLRLPPFQQADQGESARPPKTISSNASRSNEDIVVSGMLEAMGDHEFYCASYSCKEQPHIGFQDMRQSVSMLGAHAALHFNVDDVVAIGGIQVKEWQRERTLETSFSTMVEVNPAKRKGLELIEEIGDEQPKRKVMRISLPELVQIKDVAKLAEQLEAKAQLKSTKNFYLLGSWRC